MISPIYQVARQEYFHANSWSFRMPNDPELEFKVKSATLPFEKLVHKTLSTGEKVWEKWEGIETFTVEFYEKYDFSTYRYFERWFDRFYDKNRRVFRTVSLADIDAFRICNITFAHGSGFLEAPVASFTFLNVKVTEISELSLSYDDGGPLIYSVTMIADEYFQV